MKNLRSFPMEKLCFDLKLEALEQMEPRDVFELAKVNQGFQGMLVRDPSIVFGEHAFQIEIYNERIWIKKFSNSDKIELNFDRPFSHFSFVKKIRSCDHLSFWSSPLINEKYTLLKNLKSVNRLELGRNSKETVEKFLLNFHASIKKEAEMNIYRSAFNDQVINDWIENFIVGPQLKDCEKIWFYCESEDSVRFFYNALLKAEIKNVAMNTYSSRCMDLIIQQIITNGIPSRNPGAAIFLNAFKCSFRLDLSQYPGMRRVDGENRLRLLKQANDLARNFGYYRRDGVFMEKSSVFRRRFESTKDCIYVYDKEDIGSFLAFYIPVD